MFSNLKWGTRRPDQPGTARPDALPARGEGPVVPSKALPKFLSALTSREAPVLLDFGPVLGPNVGFFGERLGCKLFIEDLLTEFERHQKAGTTSTMATAFETRFRHADGSVDGVLCWDIFDLLDKPAAHALAHQIVRMLRPGGAVMGFFCTSAVAHAPFTKYEIIDDSTLRHRAHPGAGAPKHVLQNRDVIKMFDGLIVSDSFLLKNNTREMLLRRR